MRRVVCRHFFQSMEECCNGLGRDNWVCHALSSDTALELVLVVVSSVRLCTLPTRQLNLAARTFLCCVALPSRPTATFENIIRTSETTAGCCSDGQPKKIIAPEWNKGAADPFTHVGTVRSLTPH